MTEIVIETISQETIDSVTSYWENRTDGEECLGIFTEIVELIEHLNETTANLTEKITEYNEDCSDDCLDGFIKCNAPGLEDKCTLRCDCCEAVSLTCCEDS